MTSKNKQYNKIKRTRAKADKAFQLACLKLNPYSIVSGKPAEVVHHFVPKSLCMALRYDIANGITMTNGEHFSHHTKGDPIIYEKMTANKGDEWFAYIKIKRNQTIKPTLAWFEEQIRILELL